MLVLILGLAIFLGVHSIRIVADGWRSATIERIGEKRWKGYAIASIIGFVLIIWGTASRVRARRCCGCRLSACATSLAC